MLNSHIEQLEENKEMLFERETQEKATLDQTLQDNYDERDKIRCKHNKYKKEVGAQANARNSLH